MRLFINYHCKMGPISYRLAEYTRDRQTDRKTDDR